MTRIDHEGLRWLTGVASAVTLLLLAFDQWLWRAPGIRWLCEVSGRPVIHGTWWGRLDYENDGEGNPGTTEIYTAIHQTFSQPLRALLLPENQGRVVVPGRLTAQ